MELNKIFINSEYPIYLLADMAGYCQHTITDLIDKNSIESYKKRGTRFVSRDEVLRLTVLDEKLFSKIRTRYFENKLTG